MENHEKKSLWLNRNVVTRKYKGEHLAATSEPHKRTIIWIGLSKVISVTPNTNYVVYIPGELNITARAEQQYITNERRLSAII